MIDCIWWTTSRHRTSHRVTGANVPSEIILPRTAVITAMVRAVLQAYLFNCFPVHFSEMSGEVLPVPENFRTPRTLKLWEMLLKMAAGSPC